MAVRFLQGQRFLPCSVVCEPANRNNARTKKFYFFYPDNKVKKIEPLQGSHGYAILRTEKGEVGRSGVIKKSRKY